MGDTDFRAMVESAYNEAEANSVAESTGGSDGAASVPESVGVDAAPETGGAEVETPAGGDSPPAKTQDSRSRDASGKFAPKPKGQETLKPATAKPGAAESPGTVAPQSEPGAQLSAPEQVRAPQSLTPAERELFSKAPPELQKALARIDQTVRQVNQEAAPAKRFHQEFTQAIAPFERMLQQSGFESPIKAAQAAFTTISQLQGGNPDSRAQVFANLLKSYPTDYDALVRYVGNHPGAQAQQPGQPAHIDPETIIRQAEERVFNRMSQQQRQRHEAKITQQVDEFSSDPANEFMADEKVVARVAAMLSADKDLSLKDAYEQAVWSRPDLRSILQKRDAQQAAKAKEASMQQARNAASSVKSTPSTGASSVKAPKSHRDMVEAAWETLEGR